MSLVRIVAAVAVAASLAATLGATELAAEPGSANPAADSAVVAWRNAAALHVARHLNDAKPQLAAAFEALGAQGTVGRTTVVKVTLGRAGDIVSRRVVQSAGHASLDRVALEVVASASPFPAPPAGIGGETVSVSVPIRFSNRPGVVQWRVAMEQHIGAAIRSSRHPGRYGRVVCLLSVDRQGGLVSYKVQKSSGDRIVDDYVIGLVQAATPFPPPPPDAVRTGPVNVVLPIRVSDRSSAIKF